MNINKKLKGINLTNINKYDFRCVMDWATGLKAQSTQKTMLAQSKLPLRNIH